MKSIAQKLLSSCLVVFAAFQILSAQEIQSAKFSLSTATVTWKKGKSIIVRGSIENITGSKFELPRVINFQLASKTGESANFYASFDLTKIYDPKAKGCQSILTVADFETVEGADRTSADKKLVSFAGGEKKDFEIDLNGICWTSSLSSFRGGRENLFETVPAGRYQLYLEMDFYGGMKEDKGVKFPTAISLVSNKIEIEIK